MHRNKRIINFYFKDLSAYLPFIIFTALFLTGILIGNLTVGNFDFLNIYTEEIFGSFIEVREEKIWFDVFKDSALGILPVFVIIFLCGTSVVGSICAPITVLYCGLRYGFISGYLYLNFKLEGIMFNCLILLPITLIFLFGIIVLCVEAFSFSCVISNVCIKSDRTVNVYSHFKNYCIKSSATLIAAVLAVLCDVLLSTLFIGFFNF